MTHRAEKVSGPRAARVTFATAAAAILLIAGPAFAAAGENVTLPPAVRQLVQRANDATKRGDLRVATLLLKNAVEAAPHQAAIRAQLGNVLVMQGSTAEAERTLREARSQGAPDAAVLPALYQAMLSQHEGQALLQQFGEPAAADRSALAADTMRARALAYYSLNNKQAAETEIDKALALHRSPQSLVNKAEFAVARGDRVTASNLIDEALHAAPGDLGVLVMKIGLLERGGDYPGALSYANKLVQAFPTQTLPKVLRIEILTKLHQDKAAETDVNALLAATPNLSIALYDRALLDARKGDMKGAWQIAQALPPEFLRTEPQFGLAAAAMANAAGNAELSDTLLASVVSNYPDNEQARLLLAAKRLEEKNPKQALELLKPVTSQDPAFLSLMAQTYKALGQGGQAQDYQARAELAALKGGAPASLDKLTAANLKYPADPDIAGTLIAVMIREGKEAEAEAVADRFAAAAKGDGMVQFFKGQLLMAKGDLDGANDAFTATLKAKPGYAPALFYRSQVAAARGDRPAASADLDALLNANPANAQALAKKAQYDLQWGDSAGAEAMLRSAAAAAPQDPEPQLALANYYLSRKDYAKAQGAAANVESRWPADPRGAALMVRVAFAQNAPGQAKTIATDFARKAPNSEAAAILLGDVLDRLKDPGALAAYQNAVRLGHDSQAANVALTNYLLRNGDKAEALDAARGYAGRHAGPDSDLMLADTLVAVGQKDDAKVVLAKAMLHPRDSHDAQALARLQGEVDPGKDKAMLLDWLKSHPTDNGARTQLANLYIADGNMEAAERQLEPVVKLEPYNSSALNDLAWTLQKSDPVRAVKLATSATHLAPQSGEILDTLAWLKWQQNARKESLSLLRQAHALSPEEPNIAYHLAVALEATGDKDNAVRVLDAALKANPSASNSAELQRLKIQWK